MIAKPGFKWKQFFAPNSLKIQLLSRSLIILAALLVLIGVLQYVFMKDIIYKNKATSVQSQILSLPRDAWQQTGRTNEGGNARAPFFFMPETSLAYIDAAGNYTAMASRSGIENGPRLDTQEYLDALKFRKKPELNYRVMLDENGVEYLVVLQPVFTGPGQMNGLVQVSTMTGPLKELLIRQMLTFLLLSVAAMVFGLLGYLPLLRKTLVPLSNMGNTVEQINAGNLDHRFPIHQGQLEVDQLAESFNGMLERLEASFQAEKETQEQMHRFIADASHELRTPLTSIHGFLEVLMRGAANNPEQLHKALKSMHSESARLNKLVNDLLLLAKLDRTPQILLKEGSLDLVIREMEPQLHILAGTRKLSLRIEPQMICKFVTDNMKQVILNLFQNAVQHTDSETGHIEVSLTRKDQGVLLSVNDNGPGISEAHLPYVFDRFYRSDSSRARQYGGAGLGLSITQSIVESHHGTIHVTSKVGQGCSFHVWIPA
ncbi:HAMP domain-containing histidine kinase [Paenibacillus sp. WQ 127069]|uniref:histidine kinase n=1 Tax=Paenibacillus baimaensis TaxID=2982185 RepID=A0ABT2UT74_9BACL|nr:HAMP domain-containing sensor histidine kinase [Paenibacillus sp. WQ 127069]MCU6797863.1 HAMP domain-containing histidine kinase [Paenibacillus sp. WQ 127069]